MLSDPRHGASPDLSAYARQPARGPTMLAHLVAICWPMLAYVGLSCGQRGPILWLCWPMFASCWPMLSQKSRKMGAAKKRCKTQDILLVGGLSWGYVGLSSGQCGPILGLCWPSLGLSWPISELCWPILGLCWPRLEPMWAHLRAMLAHLEPYVGPCWPILRHKIRKVAKSGKSTKHCKTRGFLATPGGRQQGVPPLSPTERREPPSAMPRPGGPWPDLRAAAPAADPGKRGKEERAWATFPIYIYMCVCVWVCVCVPNGSVLKWAVDLRWVEMNISWHAWRQRVLPLPPEAQNAPCRTGKHSGPEGRNGARIEPKKCLTSLVKP